MLVWSRKNLADKVRVADNPEAVKPARVTEIRVSVGP